MCTYVKACSIALLLVLPVWGVFAQEQPAAETDDSFSGDTVIEKEEQWYRSEQISGGTIQVGDFVVGPGRTELSVAPGETVVTEISVTNRISDNREFRLEIEDITGSPDGSSPLIIVEDAEGPYSLRDYVSFPSDTFTLGLGERAWIPVQITIPPNIDPGGLYGTILVSTVQMSDQSGTDAAPRNPIIARVGSHIFVNIRGETDVSGQTIGIQTLPTQLWFESGPITFGLSYENNGSVHLNPYGEISIRNMFGQEVGYIEIEPWFVLPQSLRTREITWPKEVLFGRYTAVATVNRGYDDVLDEVRVSFWVLPWKQVSLLFVGLFIVVFLTRLFFRTFEFKKKNSP